MLRLGPWKLDGWMSGCSILGLGCWTAGHLDVLALHLCSLMLDGWMLVCCTLGLGCWMAGCLDCACVLDLGCWMAGCLDVASGNVDVGCLDVWVLPLGSWMLDGLICDLRILDLGCWMVRCFDIAHCILDAGWLGAWMRWDGWMLGCVGCILDGSMCLDVGSWMLDGCMFGRRVLDLGCWAAGCLDCAYWVLDVWWLDVRMLHLVPWTLYDLMFGCCILGHVCMLAC